MIAVLTASTFLAYGTMRAARILHHNLLSVIIGAPQAFFDTTPTGRIIARFSSDLNTVDYSLPMHLRQAMNTLFRVGDQLTIQKKKKHLNV